MLKCYLVAASSAQGVRASNVGFATVEEALLSAGDLLGHGAKGVFITDSEDNLILPADQVLLRLNLSAQSAAQPAMIGHEYGQHGRRM